MESNLAEFNSRIDARDPETPTGGDWWKGAVIYQIYPRSFMDSNGDGIGDLNGIASKLGYVSDLGVDGIWISPFYTSPMKDFGYDVSDFRDVDRLFGTLGDFKALLKRAHSLGLKVIVDQVLSHSSDGHAWFQESRQSRNNPKSGWYVWSDPKPDGSPPNNWLSPFGGGAWTWESRRGQYYFHNFLASQPDLNFHNPEVRNAQLDNLRFWLDLGVDGVRLDVVNFYYHDRRLRDNPPAPGGKSPAAGLAAENPYGFQQHVHDNTQPENLAFMRELRSVLDRYGGRTTIGEVFADDAVGVMSEYTSGNDKLHMAYTFALLGEKSNPDYIRSVISDVESRLGDGWPCWALSNHDVARCVTRWGKAGTEPKEFARILIALLLSLRGSVTLYQGEELGLPQASVPYSRIQDPYGLAFWPVYKGRDGCRTPMVWNDAEQGGFSDAEPWLPVDRRHRYLSVSRQEADAHSVLCTTRRLLRWRAKHQALIIGDIRLLDGTGDALCWLRSTADQTILVALNITEQRLSVPLRHEVHRVLEGHGFAGYLSDGKVVLDAYQAFFATIGNITEQQSLASRKNRQTGGAIDQRR